MCAASSSTMRSLAAVALMPDSAAACILHASATRLPLVGERRVRPVAALAVEPAEREQPPGAVKDDSGRDHDLAGEGPDRRPRPQLAEIRQRRRMNRELA